MSFWKKNINHHSVSKVSIVMLAILSPIAAHAEKNTEVGTVGNRVWMDINGNGIQDIGEANIANVQVELSLCGSTSIIESTTANDNGRYSFSNLNPDEKYQIAVFPNSSPLSEGTIPSPKKAGSRAGEDSNLIEVSKPSDGPYVTSCFAVQAGQIKNSIDMGLMPINPIVSGTIGNLVFIDQDGDGQYDEGEGLEGATVTASSGKDVVASMVTNSSGYYQVEVPEGCYKMDVSLPSSIDPANVNYVSTIDNMCVLTGGKNEEANFIIAQSAASLRPIKTCNYTTAHGGGIEIHEDALSDFAEVFAFYDASNKLLFRSDDPLFVRPFWWKKLTPNRVSVGKYLIWMPAFSNKSLPFNSVRGVAAVHPEGISSIKTCTTHYWTPIALDLDNDGKIGVTGSSTARDSYRPTLGKLVEFDLHGNGQKQLVEWFSGNGDGILVDNRDAQAAKEMNGLRLFGAQNGNFEHGYEKLALLDTNNDKVLDKAELMGLVLWLDDGDAVVEAGEFQALEQHHITAISTKMVMTDEGLMQSSAQRADGSSIMTEDVWFAVKDQTFVSQ